jgi:NAD(P)-dependent dehydrogenase (short-subunit alcohol dehydrogenase family)
MLTLSGKLAIITGASSGIGRATAKLFAAEGAKIVLPRGDAGVIGLTQVLAAELGPQRIRANAILPGGTDTPMGRVVANTPETQAFVAGLHALKRIAQPEEIARCVLHLASDASSFVTGSAFLVDGGVSISRS